MTRIPLTRGVRPQDPERGSTASISFLQFEERVTVSAALLKVRARHPCVPRLPGVPQLTREFIFQAEGVGPGDHVALLAHTSVDFLAFLFATTMLGGTAVVLNWCERQSACHLLFLAPPVHPSLITFFALTAPPL